MIHGFAGAPDRCDAARRDRAAGRRLRSDRRGQPAGRRTGKPSWPRRPSYEQIRVLVHEHRQRDWPTAGQILLEVAARSRPPEALLERSRSQVTDCYLAALRIGSAFSVTISFGPEPQSTRRHCALRARRLPPAPPPPATVGGGVLESSRRLGARVAGRPIGRARAGLRSRSASTAGSEGDERGTDRLALPPTRKSRCSRKSSAVRAAAFFAAASPVAAQYSCNPHIGASDSLNEERGPSPSCRSSSHRPATATPRATRRAAGHADRRPGRAGSRRRARSPPASRSAAPGR